MNSSQKKKLKGLAHHLDPVVMVGQKGITSELVKALANALEIHELIKIKFIDQKDQKKEICAELCQKTTSHLIGIIGNIGIFYKQQPDAEKRKIDLD